MLPKLAADCWSAFSSTCASVIGSDPTVATTSPGAACLAGCAEVDEHATPNTRAPNSHCFIDLSIAISCHPATGIQPPATSNQQPLLSQTLRQLCDDVC